MEENRKIGRKYGVSSSLESTSSFMETQVREATGWAWKSGARCGCWWCPAEADSAENKALQQWEHEFWSYPCAQAGVEVSRENLQGTIVLSVHVWLLSPPCPKIREKIWWAACLCALGAAVKLNSPAMGRLDGVQEHVRAEMQRLLRSS